MGGVVPQSRDSLVYHTPQKNTNRSRLDLALLARPAAQLRPGFWAPGPGPEWVWRTGRGRRRSRGAAPGRQPGPQPVSPAAASPAAPAWPGGCSVWPVGAGGSEEDLLGPQPCMPSGSQPPHLQGTWCQLAAAHHQGEGGRCDQAPQEVLQTQAQQSCPWGGGGQRGPGCTMLPPTPWPPLTSQDCAGAQLGPQGVQVEEQGGLAGQTPETKPKH